MPKKVDIERKKAMAKYVIENKAGSTAAAKHFGTNRGNLMRHINYLKNFDYELYKEAMDIITEVGKININKGTKEEKDKIKIEFAKYIIENKCTYTEASIHFGKCRSIARKYVNGLKEDYPELYAEAVKAASEASIEAIKIASKKGAEKSKQLALEKSLSLNHEKQNEIAKYIIDNHSTLKKAAEKFDVDERTIRKALKELQVRDFELYKKAYQTYIDAAAEMRKVKVVLLDDETEDEFDKNLNKARETAKKMIWFKNNLHKGDTIRCKVIIKVEVEKENGGFNVYEREVEKICTVKDIYTNFLVTNEYGTVYYDKCLSKIVKRAS